MLEVMLGDTFFLELGVVVSHWPWNADAKCRWKGKESVIPHSE